MHGTGASCFACQRFRQGRSPAFELRESGLGLGDVLCCAPRGSFQAAIDFVASAIGGFVYLHLACDRFAALRRELAGEPVIGRAGIMLCDERGGTERHCDRLPASLAGLHSADEALLGLFLPASPHAERLHPFTGRAIESALARLSRELSTPSGGARMTRVCTHHDAGFVVDLLLGLCNRQTIYLRAGNAESAAETVHEAIALEIDDLVLAPGMIEAIAQDGLQLEGTARTALARIRLHTGGEPLSSAQRDMAARLFGKVFVEPPLAALAV